MQLKIKLLAVKLIDEFFQITEMSYKILKDYFIFTVNLRFYALSLRYRNVNVLLFTDIVAFFVTLSATVNSSANVSVTANSKALTI